MSIPVTVFQQISEAVYEEMASLVHEVAELGYCLDENGIYLVHYDYLRQEAV